jgi:hypothetical protein
MNLEHVILPLLIAGFGVSALHSMRLSMIFRRTGSRVSAVIVGKRAEGFEESSALRPIVRIDGSIRTILIRDVEASELNLGDKIDVYISDRYEFGYKHLGYLFWFYPGICLLISASFAMAYAAVLIK